MNHALLEHDLSCRASLRHWTIDRPFGGSVVAHDELEVAWCAKGPCEYTIAGRTSTLLPGSAIVLRPNVEHATFFPEKEASVFSFHMAHDAYIEAADAVGARIDAVRHVEGTFESPAVLATLGSLLARETEGNDARGRSLAVDGILTTLAVEAIRSGARDTTGKGQESRDPRVGRAVQLIEERYAEALTLKELARAACISPFHFARVFRLETGKTPYRYLLDVRMKRAAELMRTRRCSVTQAALTVGCSDLGRFGRMFRRVYGVAPSAYAKRA